MRVLIVEDVTQIAEAIKSALVEAGFVVDLTDSCKGLLAHVAVASYDVVVLDLGLPDGDAITTLPDLLGLPEVPAILILTARGDVDSRIAGLNGGADDYMSKPFSLEELVARVRALVRRPRSHTRNEIRFSNIAFDQPSREVKVADVVISLTRAERDLLEHLILSPGRNVTRESLENALFGWDRGFSDNALQLQVHRLRKSLKRAGAHVRVETIRGVGYRLNEV
jgi:two-component system response regulator TctD